jgi:hypothetical protein
MLRRKTNRAQKPNPVIVYPNVKDSLNAILFNAATGYYLAYDNCQEAEEVIRFVVNDAKRIYIEFMERKEANEY